MQRVNGWTIHGTFVHENGRTQSILGFRWRNSDDGTQEYVVATTDAGNDWTEWSNGHYFTAQNHTDNEDVRILATTEWLKRSGAIDSHGKVI